MYQIIEQGTEDEFFEPEVRDKLFNLVAETITKNLEKNDNPDPEILGALAFGKIPIKDGRMMNVWVEFNAQPMAFGFFKCGIHNIILYNDEIPDIILDRYNDVKKTLFENE